MPGFTVTVTLLVSVDLEFLAVNVYVVVAAGLTSSEPEGETVPAPVSVTSVAPAVSHDSLALSPAFASVDGVAVKETMRMGGSTLTVTLEVACRLNRGR